MQGLQGTEMFFVQHGLLQLRKSKSHMDVKRLLKASSHYARHMRSAEHMRDREQSMSTEGGFVTALKRQIIPV